MIKDEIGRITKGNILLIEYQTATVTYSDCFFIQVGIAGIFCTKKELDNLLTVLNYYKNIEEFNECEVLIRED